MHSDACTTPVAWLQHSFPSITRESRCRSRQKAGKREGRRGNGILWVGGFNNFMSGSCRVWVMHCCVSHHRVDIWFHTVLGTSSLRSHPPHSHQAAPAYSIASVAQRWWTYQETNFITSCIPLHSTLISTSNDSQPRLEPHQSTARAPGDPHTISPTSSIFHHRCVLIHTLYASLCVSSATRLRQIQS